MGILGNHQLVHRSREVTLGVDATTGEEVKAIVKAPPLQLANQLRARIADPTPPVALNGAGKPRFKTDPRTGEPIKENGQLVPLLDYASPAYLAEAQSVERARTLAMIFECTTFPGPSSVEKTSDMSEIAYQLKRWEELEKAGCTIGVYNKLSDACIELSAPMTKAEVEAARRDLGVDQETSDAIKEKLGKDAPQGK